MVFECVVNFLKFGLWLFYESLSCLLSVPFFVAKPSIPTSFSCTNVNLTSLTLQWSEPNDNGGEQQLQYNIVGIPGNINETAMSTSYLVVENLTSNTTYNFTIRAGNSLGFGPGTSVVCTTERNSK